MKKILLLCFCIGVLVIFQCTDLHAYARETNTGPNLETTLWCGQAVLVLVGLFVMFFQGSVGKPGNDIGGTIGVMTFVVIVEYATCAYGCEYYGYAPVVAWIVFAGMNGLWFSAWLIGYLIPFPWKD